MLKALIAIVFVMGLPDFIARQRACEISSGLSSRALMHNRMAAAMIRWGLPELSSLRSWARSVEVSSLKARPCPPGPVPVIGLRWAASRAAAWSTSIFFL